MGGGGGEGESREIRKGERGGENRRFGVFIKAEIEKWAKVAQAAGVKIN